MLDCFDGLVSLDKTCAGGVPGILSLNQRGITEKFLGYIVNEEETTTQLLANCETLTREMIANDVVTHFNEQLHRRVLVDRQSFGEPDGDAAVLTGDAGSIGGYVVEVDQPGSNQIIRISSLGAWMTATGTLTIKIYDLADSSLVTTHDIDVIAGTIANEGVQIELPAYMRKKSYFITHDQVSFHKVAVASSGCLQCNKVGWKFGGVRVWGGRLPNGAAKIRPNVRNVPHTSGLLFSISVECDHSQMLCEIKNRLAVPYLYRLEQFIIERAINNPDRLNALNIDPDHLKERYNRAGGEYAQSLRNVLTGMRVPNDPICFECHSRTRTRIALP